MPKHSLFGREFFAWEVGKGNGISERHFEGRSISGKHTMGPVDEPNLGVDDRSKGREQVRRALLSNTVGR